jgi:hypothetical protein
MKTKIKQIIDRVDQIHIHKRLLLSVILIVAQSMKLQLTIRLSTRVIIGSRCLIESSTKTVRCFVVDFIAIRDINRSQIMFKQN